MTAVFDAYTAYYDLLYRDKDYAGEAAYVHGLLRQHGIGAGAVLELGCGTGRHAEALARGGYQVHGIDSSPAMVEQARRRLPVQLRSQLRFELGDVRCARLGTRFDAVVALFHVASYQSTNAELAAMFATASAHLRDAGLFVFDFWYGPAVLTERPAVRVKRVQDDRLTVTRIAQPALLAQQNLVDVHYTVLVRRHETAETHELEETHRMRYLFLPELDLMLQGAGLRLLRAERWLSGELDLSSWQAVIVARRSADAAREYTAAAAQQGGA